MSRPPGRTPDAIRQRSRDVYERILERVDELLSDPDKTLKPDELAQLANTMGRYGLGTQQEVTVTPGASLSDAERTRKLQALMPHLALPYSSEPPLALPPASEPSDP